MSKEREDSDFGVTDFNRPVEFESHVADPRRKTSPPLALSAKITTEKIISQL